MWEANALLSLIVYRLLPLMLTGLFAWGFVDASRRPEGQFALAARSKNFWLAVLGIGGLVYFVVRVLRWWFPFGRLVSFALLIAAVYYLGPERSRMGSPWGGHGGRGRRQRGGW
ncbi:DUF2516 family protein [Trueperella bialowiezensis]|uniref:Protein of uncharacterized function (DUF2516) n=1 Tax=Trueperella bialowiezensis TaxID=312285 RepID=A0A3S4YYI0_9ACTO|nr:DUF2516 family protein [Trueperella bialowiezensis]VEI13614.1 Protein of uncharacterised function (DUF2516) [Trueperella bialowiezensis]